MADRHKCTKQDPWKPEKGTPAEHPDAVCTYDGGWDQELAEDIADEADRHPVNRSTISIREMSLDRAALLVVLATNKDQR